MSEAVHGINTALKQSLRQASFIFHTISISRGQHGIHHLYHLSTNIYVGNSEVEKGPQNWLWEYDFTLSAGTKSPTLGCILTADFTVFSIVSIVAFLSFQLVLPKLAMTFEPNSELISVRGNRASGSKSDGSPSSLWPCPPPFARGTLLDFGFTVLSFLVGTTYKKDYPSRA